uniref:Uncharacterized protein n=1 Tax=Oryza brachyantha TaxID=4533 RepID=J3N984_ORYBR
MVVGVDVSCGCRSRSWRGRRRWSLSFAVAVVVVFAAAAEQPVIKDARGLAWRITATETAAVVVVSGAGAAVRKMKRQDVK